MNQFALSVCRIFPGLALLATAVRLAAADVVINEIMYHPHSEDVGEEYIELFNRGTNTVNLNGWRFSQGVSFAFTNDVFLAPNGYLVVAADLAKFNAKYAGVPNVMGNWTGTLNNGSESIQLENALGQNEDTVEYADQGEWALRQRGPNDLGQRGWEWFAPHDGGSFNTATSPSLFEGDKSLELIQPGLPNTCGQNWASSVTLYGTPGVQNSVRATNIAPLIREVVHSPAVPSSTDPVTVTALITDEAANAAATLFYRNHSTSNAVAFSSLAMVDDGAHGDGLAGDGVFGATIPAQAAGTVMEFYVQASDATALSRTWPAPARTETGAFVQAVNCHYIVDNTSYTGRQPYFRLLMTGSEWAQFQIINRNSNAEMNATLITWDTTGIKVRYNVGVRIRGAGSRGAAVLNYRVNIPRDRTWNGQTEINVNSQYGYAQLTGNTLSLLAGLPASETRAIQVRVNGANLASSGSPQFGAYVLPEVVNGDWAERHFPHDPNGNVYTARRPNTDLSYLGTNPVSYVNAGYSKSSNISENDWSDLINLTIVLNNAPDSTFPAQVRQIVDVQEWMTYFAMNSLLGNGETALGTGVGDDYDMYRGMLDPRFLLVAHDWDTVLAQGQGPAAVNADIFRATAVPVVNRFLKQPEFVPVYFQELLRLMDTVMSPAMLNPLIDQLLTDYVPAANIAAMKTYAANRNAYVRSQIPLQLTVSNELSIASGYPSTTSSSALLWGRAHAVDTRSVRVNGQPAAWVPWTASWTNASTALNPGLNRVVVQAFDSNNVEIAATSLDIWYDDGSVANVSGTLAANTTWTAAGGPYLVSGTLTVPAGRSLIIAPGATVYFAQGAGLSVAGVLLAEGTEGQRIRFTRQPGTATTWNGIVINGAVEPAVFSQVDFEFAEAGTHNLQVINSAAYVDHAIWTGTTKNIIDLNNSSLDVRQSIFPTIAAAEHIHGGPMPAGGFVIIDGNTFGSTTGLNDIIDFTGAARPGPIVQILNNVFTGASDDVLDLDATDAHIEGNVFMHVHNGDFAAADTSSAISYGLGTFGGTNYSPSIVAVRNFFVDVDHVALCKEGGFLTLVNNTALGIGVAAVNFSEPARGTLPGGGARIEGNIFWNPPGYAGTNFQNRFPTNGTVTLIANQNIFASTDGLGSGTGNLNVDPRLANTDIGTITATSVFQDLALRAGSPAIGSGPNGLDRGALVASGASIAGEPPPFTPLTTATLSVRGPGITEYRWRLNGGAWSAEAAAGSPIVLSGLANGSSNVVSVVGKNSAGVWQSTAAPTLSRAWIVSTSLAGVRLNELLARNSTTLVVNGETPDLVELYNFSAASFDLSGKGLTDDPLNRHKFTFPPGTTLAAGAYLTLFADSETGPGFHLGFGLDAGGDRLHFYDTVAAGAGLIDSVEFGPQLTDRSIGRKSDGAWALCAPTFGAVNAPLATGDSSTLKINEWLADGLGVVADDFLEIYNPDVLPVDLGGHFLTDMPDGQPDRHRISPLSFVPAAGYVAFVADGNASAGGNHLSFGLAPEQGLIALFSPSLSMIDYIVYGPQFTGMSEGRRPNGAASFAFFNPPTPGAGNPGPSGGTTVTNITTTFTLVQMTNAWRFNQAGTNLGIAWLATNYNDSAWSNGSPLFAFETAGVYPEPIRSPLWLIPPGGTNQVTTYYFRTKFNVNTNFAGFNLVGRVYLDDGAVFYLNGAEVNRLRITPNPVLFDTFAVNQPAEGQLETITFPLSSLVQGENTLAVEVHQGTATSTDVAFGMALDVTRTVSFTNTTSILVVLNEVLADNGTLTNLDGTLTDWVELYNPSATNAVLAGLSLTDDSAQPQRWVFPPGVFLAPGGYLTVRFDSGAPASTNNGAILNTGFGLNNGGDEVFLFGSDATLLDSVAFGPQATDFAIGRVPGGSGAWMLTLPSINGANMVAALGSAAEVRVNEWMASPKSGADWFELFNPQNQPVAIGGLYLTDNPGNRTKHPIAPLSFIGTVTNGYLKFVADGNTAQGANHVNFSLSAGGESISLFPSGSAPVYDQISFGAQRSGVSEGRLPDGAAAIIAFTSSSSPGEANYLPLRSVVISEALSHTDLPFEDAIELQNLSREPVDVSGWLLSDSINDLRKFRIPDGTVIAPGGFKVFYEYQFNSEPGFAWSFSLSSANGDQVYLTTADPGGNFTGYRDTAKFGPQENGVAFGRFETSVDMDFPAMTARTFGQDNAATVEVFRTGAGATNPLPPRIGPVVISEIMYHPPDIGTNDNVVDEFIELRNLSASAVSLFHANYPTNTWRLRDAVKFDFPQNVSLAAGAALLVVSFDPANATQLAAFRSRYGLGAGVPIYGPYSGKLDNGSDKVELYRPDFPQLPPSPDAGFVPYVLVDKVNYGDEFPWASAADGSTNGVGVSLQRRAAGAYGNEPTNWLAGVPTPAAVTGAAVTSLPVITVAPVGVATNAGNTVAFSVTATGGGTLLYQWRFKGEGIDGATNNLLTLSAITTNQAGRYSVIVANAAGAAHAASTLQIFSPPVITQQPADRFVIAGQPASFTVLATGSQPLRHQWRRNGNPLPGATNAIHSIASAQPSDAGGYSVVITNIFGSITSVVANLVISVPPVITNQPAIQIVNQNADAVFSVLAGGTAPLRYQWSYNGGALANATNAVLTLAAVQPSQAGDYAVVITNYVGAVTSQVAALTVVPLPAVTIAATTPVARETGPANGFFTVTRSMVTNASLSVLFSITGTAINGVDYAALSSPVVIPAGQASVSFAVTPVDDALAEPLETVVVALATGANYLIGLPNNATITIEDNDNLLPSIAITNPVNATLFITTPTNLVINAVAADTDGTVAKVAFYWAQTNKLGEVFGAPWNFTWTNAPAGSNALTAVATDNFGGATTSAPVFIVLNARPTVSITSPANGAAFSPGADITMNANAADSDGSVTQVVFYANVTNLLGADAAPPFSFAWNGVAVGTYLLSAVAFDNRGASRTSTGINVSVGLVTPVFTNYFSNRVTISGSPLTLLGDNRQGAGASVLEPGEPDQGNANMRRSVWISWRATLSGPVWLDTFGSTGTTTPIFDSTLGVYTGNSVDALTSVAFNNDVSATDFLSQLTFSAVAGTVYHLQVGGVFGNGSQGNIVLHLTNMVSAPIITLQPTNQFVPAGSAVSLVAAASGSAPITWQWRRNGAPIAGATHSTLVIPSAQPANSGTYYATVVNALGSAQSQSATLLVNDGLYVATPSTVIDLATPWRYNQSGSDLGTAWTAPAYDDSTWPAGLALLGFEDSPAYPYFAPITTPLTSPAQGGPVTVYLRARFVAPTDGLLLSLIATNWVDDGAVFHLNGTEVGRFRMNAGAVDHLTLAQNTPVEGLTNILSFAPAPLLPGTNVLAVEVHQSANTSSDVVFGLALTATVAATNRPAIVSAERLLDGRFLINVSGVAGRSYALDGSDTLMPGSWSQVLAFTNQTGVTAVIDNNAPAHNPRFYRVRFVQ